MTVTLLDKGSLSRLVPVDSLSAENFQELATKAYREEVPAGRVLFKPGDRDGKSIYLIEGQVALVDPQGRAERVTGGTPRARHPIAAHQPRQVTARTETHCVICRLDTDLLDILLTWDQISGIEVSEISVSDAAHATASAPETGEESDWMTKILRSSAFLQIPPANIQAMFMKMAEQPVSAGQEIVRQGEEGDFYYIIKSGSAVVVRPGKGGHELVLATLHTGDAFGEEALLSEGRRNATVRMQTDGYLMRLSKEDFNALLKAPLIHWIDLRQAKALIEKGARLLDVRLETEFSQAALPNAINLPLFMLRLRSDTLDPDVPYIAYCDTGRRSSAAAFLLGERGFETYVLRGGLRAEGKAMPGTAAGTSAGPVVDPSAGSGAQSSPDSGAANAGPNAPEEQPGD